MANVGPVEAVGTGRSSAPPLGGSWTALGPQPIVDRGDPVASGRVSALAVDPTNSATVYAGAAGGGVWKSNDGGTNWTPLTDSQLVLAIGALAIDPNDSRVIYAGTGEANHCGDCQAGQGVLKSSDGGSTWVLLGQTTFAGRAIGGLVVDRSIGWLRQLRITPTRRPRGSSGRERPTGARTRPAASRSRPTGPPVGS